MSADREIVNLQDNDVFNKIIELLKSTDASLASVLNNAVTTVASEGRKNESSYEGQKLRLGEKHLKWTSKNGYQVRQSIWDSGLGGYRSSSRNLRLVSFSWESVARKNKSFSRKFAKVHVSSRLMNLWSKPTKEYKKDSPLFQSVSSGRWQRIKKGQRREARLSMSAFYSNVESAVPKAMARVETKWQQELDKQIRAVK